MSVYLGDEFLIAQGLNDLEFEHLVNTYTRKFYMVTFTNCPLWFITKGEMTRKMRGHYFHHRMR